MEFLNWFVLKIIHPVHLILITHRKYFAMSIQLAWLLYFFKDAENPDRSKASLWRMMIFLYKGTVLRSGSSI
jgi:hypothetical protein